MDSVEQVLRTGPQLLARAYAQRGHDMDGFVRQLSTHLQGQGIAVASVLPVGPDSPPCPRCGRQDSWVRWAGSPAPRCLCTEQAPGPVLTPRPTTRALTPDPHWAVLRLQQRQCAGAGARRFDTSYRQLARSHHLLQETTARIARGKKLLETSTECLAQVTAPR
jgi:hypothetical protein